MLWRNDERNFGGRRQQNLGEEIRDLHSFRQIHVEYAKQEKARDTRAFSAMFNATHAASGAFYTKKDKVVRCIMGFALVLWEKNVL